MLDLKSKERRKWRMAKSFDNETDSPLVSLRMTTARKNEEPKGSIATRPQQIDEIATKVSSKILMLEMLRIKTSRGEAAA